TILRRQNSLPRNSLVTLCRIIHLRLSWIAWRQHSRRPMAIFAKRCDRSLCRRNLIRRRLIELRSSVHLSWLLARSEHLAPIPMVDRALTNGSLVWVNRFTVFKLPMATPIQRRVGLTPADYSNE